MLLDSGVEETLILDKQVNNNNILYKKKDKLFQINITNREPITYRNRQV